MHVSLIAFLKGVCTAEVMHGEDEARSSSVFRLRSVLSTGCVGPQKTDNKFLVLSFNMGWFYFVSCFFLLFYY